MITKIIKSVREEDIMDAARDAGLLCAKRRVVRKEPTNFSIRRAYAYILKYERKQFRGPTYYAFFRHNYLRVLKRK
jgi:hypothetical protein